MSKMIWLKVDVIVESTIPLDFYDDWDGDIMYSCDENCNCLQLLNCLLSIIFLNLKIKMSIRRK